MTQLLRRMHRLAKQTVYKSQLGIRNEAQESEILCFIRFKH